LHVVAVDFVIDFVHRVHKCVDILPVALRLAATKRRGVL
jgi:hypothetical protein